MDEVGSERAYLEQAIVSLEAQRAVLGDAVVDTAVASMRETLATLDTAEAGQTFVPAVSHERKRVTIMFADISGFTALAEQHDPEVVRDLLNACFARLLPMIEKYEGTVEKFIGDAIVAIFGAPVTHEDDAHRALRAALEMMDALAVFNTDQGTDLGMHIGVNTGLVVAGGIGVSGHQQYGVTGDAVNLAARLEDASERGEILVGPDTYRLTNPSFTFETLPPIRVKGKAAPVPVYRVLGLRGSPGSATQSETQGLRSSLVGREPEFAVLLGCVERLQAGQGELFSLTGEAGLGKSRLLAELRQQTVRHGAHVLWLEGRALSIGQTMSYWPFQEILRHCAGITAADDEAVMWQKLESRVTALFAEQSPEVLPYLASLLTLEVKGDLAQRVEYLDGDAMKRQLFLSSWRFFERLAKVQPLILVFEDAHWLDASSSQLLEHLLPLVESTPLIRRSRG